MGFEFIKRIRNPPFAQSYKISKIIFLGRRTKCYFI